MTPTLADCLDLCAQLMDRPRPAAGRGAGAGEALDRPRQYKRRPQVKQSVRLTVLRAMGSGVTDFAGLTRAALHNGAPNPSAAQRSVAAALCGPLKRKGLAVNGKARGSWRLTAAGRRAASAL